MNKTHEPTESPQRQFNMLRDIPGYAAAIARETAGRDGAYLRERSLIAGVVVRPLTLVDYLRLSKVGSPFVAGGSVDRADVALLLWQQRDDSSKDTEPRAFAERFDQFDLAQLAAACREFISEAMMDAPRGGGGSASYFGVAASILHTMRAAYPGITKAEILETPLSELWQEFRAIQASKSGAILFNPSDRIRADWLRDQSEELGPMKPPSQKPSSANRTKKRS